jgi:hypothetical protein
VASSGTTTFQVIFDPSANGLRTATLSLANDDGDENPFDFVIQGTGVVPNYTVTSGGGALVITDDSGNGDTLTVSEPAAGSIAFAASGRTFAVNGGPVVTGASGTISLGGITSITVNAAGGADTIGFGAFTGSLPNLTVNGGTGDDAVNFNGSLTFASGASLDVDLQNDDASPGVDRVSVGAGVTVAASGPGTITVKASRSLAVSGALSVVNGALTLEANQQSTPTAAGFSGVTVSTGGTVQSTGLGAVTVKGRGGNLNLNFGVSVPGGMIQGGIAGSTVQVNGQGGSLSSGRAVVVDGGTITSNGGDVQVTGTGGGANSAGIGFCYGVDVRNSGVITAGGTGPVTVNGTGGTGLNGTHIGVHVLTGGQITSGGGPVNVTGTAGSNGSSTSVGVTFNGGSIHATGAGNLTVSGSSTSGEGILMNTAAGNVASVGTGSLSFMAVGSGGQGFLLQSPSSINASAGNGPVEIQADRIVLDGGSLSAGTGTVTLRPATAGVAVDVGGADAASVLGLTDAELDLITAGTVQVGDSNSGAITVSAVISPASYGTLAFGQDVTFAGTGGFAADVTSASAYEKLTATGTVNLSPGVTFSAAPAGGYVWNGSDTFTFLANDDVDAITGTFAGPTLANFLGSTLTAAQSYAGGTGNDFVVTGVPEIAVEGNATDIADDDATPDLADHTDFGGTATAGGTVTRTFTVRNSGAAALNLSGSPKVAVSGAHAADFTVTAQPTSPVASSGTTTFQVIFDPSANGLRTATLSLANDDGNENPFDFVIQGTGVNTAPTDLALTPASLAENNAANATVGTLSATDVDAGQTHTFSLVAGAGATDNGSFTVVGTALKLTPVADFETKSSYSLRVQADDGNGGTFAKALTVTITDVPEQEISVEQPVGTLLASGAAVDFGGHAPGAAGNGVRFDGANDYIVVPDSAPLDVTTRYTFESWVRVSNYQYGTLISKFEDDGNNRGWMINFGETGDPTKLYVVQTSAGTWTNPIQWNTGWTPALNTWFHIAVVFDATLPSNELKLYVNGNLQAQTSWAHALVPNNANLYLGGYDGGGNGLNAGANERFFNGSMDDTRVWNTSRTQAEIQARMNSELGGTETGLVGYWKLNQGIAGGSNAGVTTVTATTGSNGTLVNSSLAGTTSNWVVGTVASGVAKTFTIANSGTQALGISGVAAAGGNPGDFVVDTGGMSLTVAPGGSTTFRVVFAPTAVGLRQTTLTISNNDPDEGAYTLALSGIGNSAPTDLALTPASLAENNAASATVGTLSATDVDAGQTHTFSLVAGAGAADNGSFTIVGSALKLTPVADFEIKSSYSLRVQADDGNGGTFAKALTVTITDVNEAPTDLALTPASIAENNAANATVGTLSALGDPDAGAVHTISFVSGAGDTDNASFNISGNTLWLTGSADYETKASYSVRVQADDGNGGTFAKALTVTVTDAPDAPAGTDKTIALPSASAPYTLNLADWGFTDADGPADTFAAVKITTLPASGTLKAGGVNVTAGQTIALVAGPAGATWTPVPGLANLDGVSSSLSQDGSVQVAGFWGSGVRVSANSGSSWAAAALSGQSIYHIAMSADGTKIFAAPRYNQIFKSTDSGATWAPSGSISQLWTSVACSADGTYAVAGNETGVWTTSDGGTTWTHRAVTAPRLWIGAGISADGSKMVISCVDLIYTSADYGVTWTLRRNSPGVVFNRAAMSADGTRLFVTASPGQIMVSTDSGATWTPTGPSAGWSGVSCASDGLTAVAVDGGHAYVTTDGGTTWTQRQAASGCRNASVSGDGRRMLMPVGGAIKAIPFYTSSGPGVPVVTYHPPVGGLAGTASFTFQVQDDGPSSNLDLSPNTITLASPAEIVVEGNATGIADGDGTPSLADHTDFGSTATAGGTVTLTFTVRNTGGVGLNLTGTPKVAVGGAHAPDFSVTLQPTSPVAGSGGTAIFQVTFNPSANGLRTATLSLANDDSDENPFDFTIQGTGVNAAPVAGADGANRPNNTRVVKVLRTTLLGNDSDADLDPLTITAVGNALPAGSTVVLSGGFVVYTAPANNSGHGSYEYTLSDGPGGHAVTGTVAVTEVAVVPPNPPPNAANITVAPNGDVVLTFVVAPGRQYRVQYATGAPPYAWQEFSPQAIHTPAANGVITHTDVNPPAPMRVYRLITHP